MSNEKELTVLPRSSDIIAGRDREFQERLNKFYQEEYDKAVKRHEFLSKNVPE